MVVFDEKSVAVNVNGTWVSNLDVKPGDPCFFCHEPLAYPFIYWMGTSGLALHPACVVNLASRMIPDVQRVKQQCPEHRLTLEL